MYASKERGRDNKNQKERMIEQKRRQQKKKKKKPPKVFLDRDEMTACNIDKRKTGDENRI